MVTNYQLSRRERMTEYLNSLKEEAKRINGEESVVFLAQDFLTLLTHKLAEKGLVLEVPDCCSEQGRNNEFHILFKWEKEEHYLECEIFNSGVIQFFYENYLTKEAQITPEFFPNEMYDEAVFLRLSFFVE